MAHSSTRLASRPGRFPRALLRLGWYRTLKYGGTSWPIRSAFRGPLSGPARSGDLAEGDARGPVRRPRQLLSRRAVAAWPRPRPGAAAVAPGRQPPAERGNFCLHDNEPLARYLVAEFVAHFGAFKGLAGLGNLTYRPLDSVAASGDPASSYSETVRAGDLSVRLTWSGLGQPFYSPCPRTDRPPAGPTCPACSSAVGRRA